LADSEKEKHAKIIELKHSRVSEVFKGFNVHDFEHYGQRSYELKWKFS